jgi:hypothetical protein
MNTFLKVRACDKVLGFLLAVLGGVPYYTPIWMYIIKYRQKNTHMEVLFACDLVSTLGQISLLFDMSI